MTFYKVNEGEHYELILNEEEDEHWSVRILKGAFTETIIKFHKIAVNEEKGALSFNFHVISSPNPEAHIDNPELQKHAGWVLQDVLETCIDEGSAKFTDRETGKEVGVDEVFSDGTSG